MKNDVIYSKTVKLGKIDVDHNNQFYDAEIQLELRDIGDNKTEFSAVGVVWNQRHSDWLFGGQCIDKIAKYFPNDKKVQRICEVWSHFHLNSLHAGCIHQREFEKEPYEKHADAHCDICNYTYGHGWQYEEIPADVIEEIKNF